MVALSIVGKELGPGPGSENQIGLRKYDGRSRSSSRLFHTIRTSVLHIEGEHFGAQAARHSHPRKRLNFGFEIGCIGCLQDVAVCRGAEWVACHLRHHACVDIIHPCLKAHGTNGRHPNYLCPLPISDISSKYGSGIGLLDAGAVYRVILKICKIGVQVELVILRVCVGEKLTTRERIVVVVQFAGGSERLSAFGRIDGAKTIQAAVVQCPERDFTRCIPLRVVKRGGETEFVAAGKIRGHLPEQVRSKVSVVVEKWAVRVVSLTAEERADLVLWRREHENISLRIELSSSCLNDSLLDDLAGPKIHRAGRI